MEKQFDAIKNKNIRKKQEKKFLEKICQLY